MEIRLTNHLKETNKGYFEHLLGAWKVAFILLVHGLLPNVWEDKASNIICSETIRVGPGKS
tara:strand:- start:282 stop:464 length:183 start_codon:yes stop_codon:yes gene_type:complete